MNQQHATVNADKAVNSPHDLIASDRVEGTSVYRSNGDRIGHVERIMIEKVSGKSVYAIMNFGGFLGIGEDSYPIPWSMLTYNPKLGGYEVNLTDEQLKNAPKFGEDADWDRGDRMKQVYDYYGVPPYWL